MVSSPPLGDLETPFLDFWRSKTAATEFGKIRRKRASPFTLVIDGQPRRVQSLSRQQESLLELMGPSSFDETQVQVLVGAVDFIAYYRMTD